MRRHSINQRFCKYSVKLHPVGFPILQNMLGKECNDTRAEADHTGYQLL